MNDDEINESTEVEPIGTAMAAELRFDENGEYVPQIDELGLANADAFLSETTAIVEVTHVD